MNLSMWTAMREYIAAEIKLGIARGVGDKAQRGAGISDDEVRKLQEQSTRMETAVREHVAKLEAEAARTRQTNMMNTRFR